MYGKSHLAPVGTSSAARHSAVHGAVTIASADDTGRARHVLLVFVVTRVDERR